MNREEKQKQRENICKVLRDKIENNSMQMEIDLFQKMNAPARVINTMQANLLRYQRLYEQVCSGNK